MGDTGREPNEILDALITVAPPIITPITIARNCIFCANVGIRALRYFGIEAAPFPCDVAVFNPEYCSAIEAGITDEKELIARGGWVVAVDLGRHDKDGYGGHLMIELAGGNLLDLSFAQFNRKHKNIELPPIGAFKEFDRNEEFCIYRMNGCAVRVRAIDDGGRYKRAPDWKREYREIVGEIIRGMKGELKNEGI